MWTLVVKELTNASPIHVIIMATVLTYGKHSVVSVRDLISGILVNIVS